MSSDLRPAREFGETSATRRGVAARDISGQVFTGDIQGGVHSERITTSDQSGGVNASNSKIDVDGDLTGRDKYEFHAPVTFNQAADQRPAPAITIPLASIPAGTETYIPRGDIEDKVRARLRQHGTAAIVGVYAPGGVGKSELAIRAARELAPEFGERVLWLTLTDKSAEQVVGDMARWCGLDLHSAPDFAARVAAVKSYWQAHPGLVVLDDVDKTNEAQLADLLPPRPPCAALVT
ncbi:MAG: hypothetical protein LC737_03335, partial [Chloroflexi bacterium]|nr:hypothetical protein [Chloroflexota bacterium]